MHDRREVNCLYYSSCLDLAIDSNQETFNCRRCTQYEPCREISFQEVVGCGRLLREIFFRKKVERRQPRICPRCGRTHHVIGGKGAAWAKSFCKPCLPEVALYDHHGYGYELRGLPYSAFGDEPGLGESS